MPCLQMGKDGLKAFHPSKNVHVIHVQCCEKGIFFNPNHNVLSNRTKCILSKPNDVLAAPEPDQVFFIS